MTTLDTVFLGIASIALALFFLIMIVVGIMLLKLVAKVKRVVAKAEDVIDSVESAAEVFRDTKGHLGLYKLVRNIYKMANRRRK